MAQTHPRPWFQFHLLTAVLMIFAAGTLLGIELDPYRWFNQVAWLSARNVICAFVLADLAIVMLVGLMVETILRSLELRHAVSDDQIHAMARKLRVHDKYVVRWLAADGRRFVSRVPARLQRGRLRRRSIELPPI